MALLPRYQRTGIQIRQPQQMDFAAEREKVRLGQTIAQQVDRMSDFAFKLGAEQAEIRGQERVREEGALPTLKQLDAQNGPRTIAEKSAYEAANRVAVVEIESEAKNAMQSLIRDADKSNMSMSVFETKMADIRDGYIASLDVVSPVAAGVLETRLNDTGVTYSGKYSDIVTRKARVAWGKKVEKTISIGIDEIVDSATQEGATRETIQAAGEKLVQTQIDLGVNEDKARNVAEKAIASALKNNVLYRYDNAADISTKRAILDEVKQNGLPGYDYSQVRSFTNGIESNLNVQINQAQNNFKSDLNDAITVMSFTGEIKPGFNFDDEQVGQIFSEADANALRGAWEDAQEDAKNFGSLADMSPARIQEITNQLFSEISDPNTPDPAKAGQRYTDWVQRVQKRETALKEDAALFVVQTNESAAGMVENIQSALGSGDIAIAAQGILSLNDIMQTQYNMTKTPQGQRKIMPKAMAAGIVQSIKGIDTDVAAEAFRQLQENLGDLAPAFIEELRAQKLPPEYVEAMYQTNSPGLQKELLDMAARDLQDIKAGQPQTNITDADNELYQSTEAYRKAFVTGGNKAAEDIFNEQFALAQKLAYSRMKSGADAASAAESAVNDIFSEVDNVFTDANKIFVLPTQFDSGQVARNIQSLMNAQALSSLDVVPLDSEQYPGYVDEAVSLASIATTGVWLNNSTGDGVVLHYNVNGYYLPVLNSKGDNIDVKFTDLPTLAAGTVRVTNPRIDLPGAKGAEPTVAEPTAPVETNVRPIIEPTAPEQPAPVEKTQAIKPEPVVIWELPDPEYDALYLSVAEFSYKKRKENKEVTKDDIDNLLKSLGYKANKEDLDDFYFEFRKINSKTIELARDKYAGSDNSLLRVNRGKK